MSHLHSDDCIFCKIVNNDIPASRIYEDDNFFAFLDMNPVNPGHVLVIPRGHYESFLELPQNILEKYLIVVQQVTRAVASSLEVDGYNIMQNNGKAAGQSVFHVHFHIVPRFKDDSFKLWNGTPYAENEMPKYARKIIEAL